MSYAARPRGVHAQALRSHVIQANLDLGPAQAYSRFFRPSGSLSTHYHASPRVYLRVRSSRACTYSNDEHALCDKSSSARLLSLRLARSSIGESVCPQGNLNFQVDNYQRQGYLYTSLTSPFRLLTALISWTVSVGISLAHVPS
jgi:hypothetical protein